MDKPVLDLAPRTAASSEVSPRSLPLSCTTCKADVVHARANARRCTLAWVMPQSFSASVLSCTVDLNTWHIAAQPLSPSGFPLRFRTLKTDEEGRLALLLQMLLASALAPTWLMPILLRVSRSRDAVVATSLSRCATPASPIGLSDSWRLCKEQGSRASAKTCVSLTVN